MRHAARSIGLLALLAMGQPGLSTSGHADEEDAPPIPVLEVPLRCDTRTTCFIQNYVDADPGTGARDMTCGPLTYDGHDGVDIRLLNSEAMELGVTVVAAAPGTVRAVRDGMSDISIERTGMQAVAGREAGNAVVIVHEGGWETQYSHLRLGSIIVRPGDPIEAGTPLGLVGLSGKTEFPHLHFSVRHNNIAVDPFTSLPPGSGCGIPGKSLWSPLAQEALPYRAGGLLVAGFASEVLDLHTALSGPAAIPLSKTDPAVVFWAVSWGLRGGDAETIRILHPDGTVLTEHESRVPGNKAQWLRYTGRKRLADAWPEGRYRGEYKVVRQVDGKDTVVVEVSRTIEVR